jgi:aldehyde:ferredoxin oxidoreductase
LAYLTSTRGSDHLRAGFSIETHPKGAEIAEKLFGDREVANPRNPRGKGKGVKWFEDFSTVIDALGLCKFNYRRMFDDMSEARDAILKAYYIATGITLSLEELLGAGERIYNVEKAFNVRLGQSRKDDNFSNPEKFLKEPLEDGAFKGQVFPLDVMLDEYYEARGWGMDGLPKREKLEELGIKEIADELQGLGKLSEK